MSEKSDLKVVILATTFLPERGGAQRFCDGLARHLSQRGYNINLLVPYGENTCHFPYKIIPLKGLKFGSLFARFLPFIITLNLIKLYRRFHFEVLQVVGFYPAGYGAALFKRIYPNCKLIIRGTGSDVQVHEKINYGMSSNPLIAKKIKKAIDAANWCVANSDSMAEDLRRLKAEKIVVIPNGLDLERFKGYSGDDLNNIRLKYTGVGDSKIILNVGRIEQRKNQKLLIQSFGEMSEVARKNCFLIIVGKGEDLTAEINDFQLNDCVKIIPEIGQNHSYEPIPPQELIELFLASHVYAHPSLLEGQPNVLLEAMAAGLPMVALNVPGSRDVIKPGKTGFLVNNDAAEFKKALLKLISDDKLHSTYSNNALQASKTYNWNVVVKEYEKLYQ